MKGILFVAGIVILSLSSCQQQVTENVKTAIQEKKDAVVEKAADEMKGAVAAQIDEFFKSSDLSDTLGITQEQQEEVKESIKQYIEDYQVDGGQVAEIKDAVSEILTNPDGISQENVEEKLQEILGEDAFGDIQKNIDQIIGQ